MIAHSCALANAEKYGDSLTDPCGHYELWEAWRTEGAPDGIADIVRDAEYEEWPRGRVVFDTVREVFVGYADAQILRRTDLRAMVRDRFQLPPDSTTFEPDEHYASTRTLRA